MNCKICGHKKSEDIWYKDDLCPGCRKCVDAFGALDVHIEDLFLRIGQRIAWLEERMDMVQGVNDDD